MELPADLLHRVPEEAARRIALSFLNEAHAASLRLDDPAEPEALHDFRVAIRRMRSTLRAWRSDLRASIRKRHRRGLKALQNATGAGRDAEVAVLWLRTLEEGMPPEELPALRWVIERLEQRHAAAMAHVNSDVREAFGRVEDDLRSALRTMRREIDLCGTRVEATYAVALAAKVREHVEELLLHLGRVKSVEDREEAHQTRIMGKRLRYLVEPLKGQLPGAARVVKLVKKLQDVLGDLNDVHVLQEDLGPTLAEAQPAMQTGVRAIRQRVEERGGTLFGELERDWLGREGAALAEASEALARHLEEIAATPVEIERKYLLRALPELPDHARALEIDQGWLPGERLRERLRRVASPEGQRYLRTVKLGQGLQRIEIEEETTASVYEALWALTAGCRVRKRRYQVADGDLTWEIDEFLDRELFLAEVEFADPTRKIELPVWLAPYVVRDVTGSSEYVNLNLAT